MTYIGAVFPVQLTCDTSQISKWGQTRLGCVDAFESFLSSSSNLLTYLTYLCSIIKTMVYYSLGSTRLLYLPAHITASRSMVVQVSLELSR